MLLSRRCNCFISTSAHYDTGLRLYVGLMPNGPLRYFSLLLPHTQRSVLSPTFTLPHLPLTLFTRLRTCRSHEFIHTTDIDVFLH